MTNNLNEEQRFAVEIMEVVNSLFDEESEFYKYDLHNIDLTAFFTGFVIANSLLVSRVTGQDLDVLDTLAQNTRLFMQYSQKQINENNK